MTAPIEEEWIPFEDTPVSANTEIENPATGSDQVSVLLFVVPHLMRRELIAFLFLTQYTEYGHGGLRGIGCAPTFTSKITIVPISSRTEIVETASGHSAKVNNYCFETKDNLCFLCIVVLNFGFAA